MYKLFGIFYFLLIFALAATASPTKKQQNFKDSTSKNTLQEAIIEMLQLADTLEDQYPDSALAYSTRAEALADSLKIKDLSAKASYRSGMVYYNKMKFTEAADAFSKSMAYSSIAEGELHIKNLIGMAEVHYQKLDFDSALILLDKAKSLAARHEKMDLMANIYNNQAKIYGREGKAVLAIEGYLKAASLFGQQNRLDALAVVYDNIGTLYARLKNYPDAIQYYQKAVEINQKENKVKEIHRSYNHLGNVYSQMDSLEKARYYYELVIENARISKNEYDLAKGFLNLANLLSKQGSFKEAGKYYDSAVYYSEKNNILYGIIASKLNMGNYYNKTGDHQSSLKTLRDVQSLTASYKMPEMKATLYNWMSAAFKGVGVYDSALYYFELYEHLNDSIFGQETKNTVLALEKKYESERKAREINELQKKALQQKTRNNLYMALLLFVILILIAITMILLARRRAAALSEELVRCEVRELETAMELRNQELVSKALMVSNLNEQLEKINKHVKLIKPSLSPEIAEQLDIMVHELEISLPEHAWNEFETWFDKVHQGFFNELMKRFPELSPTELKICSLLRLNMTTKDMALLTNRSAGTIDNIRSSIRKKLKLETDENLTVFLLNL